VGRQIAGAEMGLDDRVGTIEVGSARAFRRVVRRELAAGSALLHCHGIWLRHCHDSILLSRKQDAPVIVSAHGMLAPWAFRSYRSWRKRAAWLAYQKRDLVAATMLHATAPAEVGHFREVGLRQPVAVVPPGVVVPIQPPREPRRGPRRALFLGRIHPVKNIDGLLRSWAALRPTDWQLVIAGVDPEGHLPALKDLARSLSLGECVEFAGPAWGDDKERAYAAADLFLLPSFSENFGIVVAEALARGLPVLTTRGAPWGDLVAHDCGWWLDLGQEALDEGLRVALSTSPEELVKKGGRGRELVERKYTWDRAAHSMVEVYRRLRSGGPVPDCVVTS
jgi:glycosyltransferase involved in cell wall biosynthesis